MKGRKARVLLYVRKFLNSPGTHAGAYIIAKVTSCSQDKKDGYINRAYCQLDLADCSRVISLDFGVGDPSSLRKLDVLVDTLVRFREALVAAQDEYKEVLADKKKRGIKDKWDLSDLDD